LNTPEARCPLLLDLELGTDAAQAVAFAEAMVSTRIELVAVTVVGREATQRARMAVKLADLFHCRRPSVHVGSRTPLAASIREQCSPEVVAPGPVPLQPDFRWFGYEPEEWLEPTEEPAIESESAVEAIRRLLAAQPGLHVLALGPLTNFAQAVRRWPECARQIGQLRWWGEVGASRSPRVERVLAAGLPAALLPTSAAYNRWIDPDAYDHLCAAGVRIEPLSNRGDWLGPHAAGAESQAARQEAAGGRLLRSHIRLWEPIQRRLLSAAGFPTSPRSVSLAPLAEVIRLERDARPLG